MRANNGVNREVALRLYAAGWRQVDIAEQLGHSPTTIRRWVLPGATEQDRRNSRAWKARNREHCREYDHGYHQRTRKTCPQCAQPMSGDSKLCRQCRTKNAELRRTIIIGCWNDGWTIREIAAVLDSTPNSLGVTLVRLRQAGRIGYRYPGWTAKANHTLTEAA